MVSLASIAVSTTALLLVLSVFNGLEDLVTSLFRSFDPDIKITLKKGKTFQINAPLRQQINELIGVAQVVDVLEDNALIRHRDHSVVVKLKGVSEGFLNQNSLASFIRDGEFKLKRGEQPLAILGSGVQYALRIPWSTTSSCVLQVFYPNNVGTNALLQQQLYRSKHIQPGAVFAIEQGLDSSYVIVPIDFAAALTGKQGRTTALEIKVAQGYSVNRVQQKLKQLLHDDFYVFNSQEQQATLLKAIHIERFFVFSTLAFILCIASCNIFFVLTMLARTKKNDIVVLYTLGANARDVRLVFLIEGLLIALGGAAIGMIVAWVVSWLQQTFGLVTLGTQTSLVAAYPVKRKLGDFVYTAVSVVSVALMAAYRPAQLAAHTAIAVHRR